MIDRFQLFLGPARVRALVIVIAGTGLVSLVLNAVVDEYEWVRPVQMLLFFAAIIGAVIIIGGRLDPVERGRWSAVLLPSLGALLLGATVLPHLMLPLAGAAVGWVVAGLLLFRTKTPTEYQQAIRHLRRGEYEEAVKMMDEVIRAEPNEAAHYRFRAELLRLWGKLDRARRDYYKMTELEPESAVAFNGLAEVHLQAGDYEKALDAALRAAELAPEEWVAQYNLGMIEDRLSRSGDVIEHLGKALAFKVPDARHRLLIHLYLARAHARLGQWDDARTHIDQIKRHKGGLEEWQKILASPQAETLRSVLGADVELAQEIANGGIAPEALAASGPAR